MLERARRGLAPELRATRRAFGRECSRRSRPLVSSERFPPTPFRRSVGDLAATGDAAPDCDLGRQARVLGAIAAVAAVGYVLDIDRVSSEGRSHDSGSGRRHGATSSAAVPAEQLLLQRGKLPPSGDTHAAARSGTPRAHRAQLPSASQRPAVRHSTRRSSSSGGCNERCAKVTRGWRWPCSTIWTEPCRTAGWARSARRRTRSAAVRSAWVLRRCFRRDFTAKYPSSVHSARVTQACGEGRDQ